MSQTEIPEPVYDNLGEYSSNRSKIKWPY
jgi:hypothetical protein